MAGLSGAECVSVVRRGQQQQHEAPGGENQLSGGLQREEYKKPKDWRKEDENWEERGHTCPVDGLIMKAATQLATGISARSVAVQPIDQSGVRQKIAMRRMHPDEAIERTTVPSGCSTHGVKNICRALFSRRRELPAGSRRRIQVLRRRQERALEEHS